MKFLRIVSEAAGVLQIDGDDVGVRFEREYGTSPRGLWAAVTEPERVARWLDSVTGDLRVGGVVTVQSDDEDADFEIVRCEPITLVEVHWLHAESVSLVRAEVSAGESGGSRLVLEHSRLTAEHAPAYAAGWHWHLRALAAVLRGEQPEPWGTLDALHESYVGERDQIVRASEPG